MDAITKAVVSYVSNFRTPRFMDVQDFRLGSSNLALQIAIFVYFIIVMVSFKQYETKYTPDGTAQYFMAKGDMYDIQADANTAFYCNNTNLYKYTDPDCAGDVNNPPDLFWYVLCLSLSLSHTHHI